MENCRFCSLIKGEGEVQKVFEDEQCLVFMDRQPINPGHVLVIPKTHVADFYDMDETVYSHVFLVVKKLSQVIKNIYSPDKVGVVLAGYDVAHAHIHIIPMHHPDDITSRAYEGGARSNPSQEELSNEAKKMSKFV